MQSKGLSRVFSNTTVQSINSSALSFFIVQLSHPHLTTRETIALTRWTFVGQVMSLLFNMLSRWVIAFFPRGQRPLIGDVDTGQTPSEGCCSRDRSALSSVWPLLVSFSTVSAYPVYSSPPTAAHTQTHQFLKKILPFHVFCGKCGFLNDTGSQLMPFFLLGEPTSHSLWVQWKRSICFHCPGLPLC